MPEIMIVGSGGHAGVLVSIARRDRLGVLAGYLDREDRGERLHGAVKVPAGRARDKALTEPGGRPRV